MTHTPTPEQALIIEAVATTSDPIIVTALAGAAKTTTLVMAAHKLPLVPTASVSFNKRIAEEMAKRMPGHIQCSTMNSLGHRVWANTVGKRLRVESDKMYAFLKEEMDNASREDKRLLSEAFPGLLRTLRRAKSMGYIPQFYRELGQSLANRDDLIDSVADELDVEPDEYFMAVVDKLLNKSIAEAYQGLIDFDDQIYMSTLFGGNYPRFPIIMIDEAQDLSPLNHETLAKMNGGRLIAVGDPNQSIYAFRGADVNSMEVLKNRFSMRELSLSVSFRCPRAVIRRAQKRAPQMQWPEWAIEGKVEVLEDWSSSDIPDGAAILCRNNAPLFSCALALIRSGRGVKLVGADLGPALVKLLKKLSPDLGLQQKQVLEAITSWEEKEIRKARDSRHAGIRDRADCLRVFAEYGATLGAAIAWAENLFKATGTVLLMTGHKAKGLEFDTVFILDPWRIPSKWALKAAELGDPSKLQQERNLEYVMQTRAMKEMFLVNLDTFS